MTTVAKEKGAGRRPRVLVISQTFAPDPASVGQHMTDAARELLRRGYEVRVFTSARGYENPKVKYPRHENLDGLDVRRLPLASFGKKSILTRVIGTASFMMQVMAHQLFTPRLAGIFFSTSPPLVGTTSCVTKMLRGVPIAYWAMDLNPDQLIVMGKIKETSFTARFLEGVNRFILRKSSLIIVLDRFMGDRLLKRGDFSKKMIILPPWPHEEHIEEIDQSTNPFRLKHGLVGKRVIMYSGNHSPANPLKTLLDAAITYKEDDRIRFVFVGGGLGKKEVNACIAEHGLKNMLSLPYQPLEDLKYSLTAADVHVVSMGDSMAGIIHPCKIYGAMTAGRPVLYLGPSPSHISDILKNCDCGWQVQHGDGEGMKKQIAAILAAPEAELRAMGVRAGRGVKEGLSQEILQKRLGEELEAAFGGKPHSLGL